MGRTLGLELDQSHCGKNTQFGTGPFTLWEEYLVWDWVVHTVGRTLGLGLVQSHSVWDWAVHFLGRTLGLGMGQSYCGKNTQFWTGAVILWEEHSFWDWADHIVGRTFSLGLGQSNFGKNTQFGTGLVTFVGRTQAEGV